MVIEEICHKSKIQLGISSGERARSQKLAAVQSISILEHLLGTLEQVSSLEWCSRAILRGKLIKENGVVLAVFDVS